MAINAKLSPPDMSLYGGAELTMPSASEFSSSASSASSDSELDTNSSGLKQRRSASAPQRTTSQDDDEHQRIYGLERADFLWTMTEEPHRSRRLQILKAHPEIKSLMGYTPVTKYLVLLVVALQLSVSVYLRETHPFSLKFISIAYCIGGTANQNLFLAIHEIVHNLAFKGLWSNRLLAMIANLGIGVPYSVVFKKYHLEHHKRMGEDGVDTDIPCKLEAMCLNNVAGKTFFAIFQILFYALRPGFIRSQGKFTRVHALNFAIVLTVDALLVWGTGSFNPMYYLLMSSFFAGSLHPLAGHFIAEHYVWEEGNEQETYSYYGWLNWFAYNVGYHNEHHDFPNVPWTRFITDPKVGMFSRIKRENRGD
ncbi:dihydroceramide delta-desaturase [Phaffia rhodozyma]|uniref:Dihydroceramide delta-desaturase n=1 Tax=Phaffia rhodozyma TaxID=264483 RepID=A0A0F7SUB8_PHARH|nr:dihydroceramide delta-desaturase [Phaffia rhodozyma]